MMGSLFAMSVAALLVVGAQFWYIIIVRLNNVIYFTKYHHHYCCLGTQHLIFGPSFTTAACSVYLDDTIFDNPPTNPK